MSQAQRDCSRRPLLAKSVTSDAHPAEFNLTVAGHCLRVARCADALLDELEEHLITQFGFPEEDVNRLRRILVLAAFFHDIGKANRSFQNQLRKGARDRHPFLHEVLSAVLIKRGFGLSEWLSENINGEDLQAVAMVVAGHHVRARQTGFQEARTPRPEEFYLTDSSLTPLWTVLKNRIGADDLPALEDREYGWQEIQQMALSYVLDGDGLEQRLREAGALHELRRLVSLAKGLLIAADILGSTELPEDQSIEEWVNDSLRPALSPRDLSPIIQEGLSGGDPYEFQRKVADSLERVTLVTAGCGNGKTLAAYMWAQQQASGRRLVFCYPTTGTTSAGFQEYLLAQTDLERALLHSRAAVDIQHLQETVNEEGGVDPMQAWARDVLDVWPKVVVACTVDTVLGFLAYWRRSLATMPLWTQAAFVFDEIHSYDASLFGALLAFLREVRGAPVLLMTASLSEARHRALKEAVGRKLTPIQGKPEIEGAPRYCIERASPQDAVDRVCSTFQKGAKILWVTNTVGRSRETFERFEDLLPAEDVRLYHSRFRYADRVRRQENVIQSFRTEGATLVVATQVCEMSLDISANLLITELAPFPALMQRMGRLNRAERVPEGVASCLVLEPPTRHPYSRAELDDARQLVDTLRDQSISQADLAAALARLDEDSYEMLQMPFSTELTFTEPGKLREGSYTVTIVRSEDLETIGRPTRADIIRLGIPVPLRDDLRSWRNLKGVPVAPPGTITYDPVKGASWAS